MKHLNDLIVFFPSNFLGLGRQLFKWLLEEIISE
jgi:hypothetical protein